MSAPAGWQIVFAIGMNRQDHRPTVFAGQPKYVGLQYCPVSGRDRQVMLDNDVSRWLVNRDRRT
jgi:hypothetical protein